MSKANENKDKLLSALKRNGYRIVSESDERSVFGTAFPAIINLSLPGLRNVTQGGDLCIQFTKDYLRMSFDLMYIPSWKKQSAESTCNLFNSTFQGSMNLSVVNALDANGTTLSDKYTVYVYTEMACDYGFESKILSSFEPLKVFSSQFEAAFQ